MTRSDDNADENNENIDYIDKILNEIGGSFKLYQILNYLIFCIPLAISGTLGLSYVFTALNLDYRCSIPECENSQLTVYKPDWLPYAVPFKNEKPSKCLRFQSNASVVLNPFISYVADINNEWNTVNAKCPAYLFNKSSTIRCERDTLLFRTDEVSIASEFDILCEENDWKLAMVGTANNIGRFLFTPFMGYLSDRFGRRTMLIIGIVGSSSFAMLQSFSINYTMFITLEFLTAAIGSITYSGAFVMALEWIGVKNRIKLLTLVTATYPVGQVFLGVTALFTRNFRILLRIIAIPGFFIISYIWLAPESIRWLMVNGEQEKVVKVLTRAAKINHMEISPSSLDMISKKCKENMNKKNADCENASKHNSIWNIFSNRRLIIRFLICAFNWITNAFVSYGISLTSVSLAGDKYINFIVIALAGVPAMYVCYMMLEKLGRRWTLIISLSIGGSCIIGSKILPSQYTILSIIFFFIGKLFITVSFTGLYVYTSELWPTNLRHSIMSLCSTCGRIGSMLAPLAPLLSAYIEILPYLLFGGMAIAASLLVLKLPETLNQKLPDTLKEAELIGLKTRSKPSES